MYPVGHFGFVPVTLIVFPFLTQVIVFFLLFEDEEGEEKGELEGLNEAVGLGDSLATGELEGVGDGDATTISAALFEGDGVGVALAKATGPAVGNRSLS